MFLFTGMDFYDHQSIPKCRQLVWRGGITFVTPCTYRQSPSHVTKPLNHEKRNKQITQTVHRSSSPSIQLFPIQPQPCEGILTFSNLPLVVKQSFPSPPERYVTPLVKGYVTMRWNLCLLRTPISDTDTPFIRTPPL